MSRGAPHRPGPQQTRLSGGGTGRAVKDPGATSDRSRDQALERIDRALVRAFGIQCLPQRSWLLDGRASRRAAELGLSGLEEYAEFLEGRPREMASLFEMVRIGQTSWMRHARFLDQLIRDHLLDRGNQPSIWSAGCGTGQEAYSVAMLLFEAGRGNFRVIGTDLSETAVKQAAAGFYDEEQARGLEETLRRKYWIRRGRGIEAGIRLRRACSFSRHNLMSDPLPEPQDAVLCRNVLMYFEAHAAQKVMDRLVSALKPGGVLLLGPSELGKEVAKRLEPLRSSGGVLWRKPAKTRQRRHGTNPEKCSRETDENRPVTMAADMREDKEADATIMLKGSYTDERIGNLEAVISAHLVAAPRVLVVDLDGADFLCDQAAEVISRAAHHMESFGGVVKLKATKLGVQRWIRRCGLTRLFMEADARRGP